MLLIFPPVAKTCEPPAGIARLASALKTHGLQCHLLDANLEGQLWLLEQPPTVSDTWTRRAFNGLADNLDALRDAKTYHTPDRYRRAVSDLNRLLAVSSQQYSATVGLSDYQHASLSPLSSADLIAASEQPQLNPFFPYFSRRLKELLAGVGTVGFSLNYLSQALSAFAMIGYIRGKFPDHKIILGGGLVTSWMRRPGWCNPFGNLLDLLIVGPGEQPLLEFFGAETDLKDKEHVTPDYAALPLRQYLSPGMILPYSTAGGCWWNRCTFCPEQAEGNDYRPIAVNQVLSDLQHLTKKNGPSLIHILDNAISPALLRGLADNPPGAPWYGFARVDEQLADPDFCHALKTSGCTMLKLGLESGNQSVLDSMLKGIDLVTVSRVLSNLKRAGIAVYCYLLFGTPAETEDEARETLEFVVRHRDEIDFLNLAIFNMPLCGDGALEYGTVPFYVGDLSLYTAFNHPDGWNRKKVRRFLEQEFKRDPAVAAILRNDPPQFTSNHAPFFNQASHRC
jgi:hypothetical protein